MTFDSLGLTPELLRAVADQGYTTPTPVQAEAIPLVLAGRDVLAGAQTGTGKTAAFVLPILQGLHARPLGTPGVSPGAAATPRGRSTSPVRVLVLVPTRELALQVEESVRTYGAQRPVRSVPIYGGVGYEPQLRALRRGVEVVVATPGRLIDHLQQGSVDLSRIEVLVLDEADRMLDMGFIRDIRRIIALIPVRRQTLLFSATFSDEIRRLAGGLLRDPAQVQVTPRNTPTELVRQVVIRVDRERKRHLLTHLVQSGRIDQALVFTRTKHGANRLAQHLVDDGIVAAAIHGNRSQSQRVRALDDFKAGRVALLVATEVAARGIDIDSLPHVVNFELPMVPEDYVHRIGRTGRAGSEGDAISLVCVDEARLLADIEALLGHRIAGETVPGYEPDPRIRPEAIRLRTGGFQQGNGPRPRPAAMAPHRSVARPQNGTSIGTQPGRWPVAAAQSPRSGAPRPPFRAPVPQAGGHPPMTGARPPRPGFSASRPYGPAPQPNGPAPRSGTPAPRPGGFVALPGERFSGRRGPAPERSR